MEDLNMAEIVIKWHTPILLLLGTVLSFADPITDILTPQVAQAQNVSVRLLRNLTNIRICMRKITIIII